MAVRTQAQLLADIAADLPTNTSGAVSEQDVRDICQDLADTAEDRWGNDASAVDTDITNKLADNSAGDISPEDGRDVFDGHADLIFDVYPFQYRDMAEAEAAYAASPIPWQDGDLVVVAGIEFIYHSAMVLFSQIGLIHKDPFGDGSLTTVTEINSFEAGSDTDTWIPPWAVKSSGGNVTADTVSGDNRVNYNNSSSELHFGRSAVLTSSETVIGTIIDRLKVPSIGGNVADFHGWITAAYVDGVEHARAVIRATGDDSNWDYYDDDSSTYLDTGSDYSTATRFWQYVKNGSFALYTDNALVARGNGFVGTIVATENQPATLFGDTGTATSNIVFGDVVTFKLAA